MPELAKGSEGFNTNFLANLYNIEPHNFWFRSRNHLIIWALQNYFPEAKNLYEIGVGTGFVLSGIESAFPHLQLYGSDIYIERLTYAANRFKKAKLFQMDARNIPFESEFDVIGAFDVLEHIEEDELVLSQMHQALKKREGLF
ncbi:MAG: class I SAM-dependent methyltransferase [Nitrospirota bacterium]